MARKFPSLCFHGICYLRCILNILVIIKIRIVIQEFLLVILKIFFGLVGYIRSVSQYPVITGHRKDSLAAMIGKIRMFFDKRIQQRNKIIISYQDISISINVLCYYISIFIEYKFGCTSITIHIMIITDIVLRKHKRDLALRHHDLATAHRTILVHCCHVMRAYQNIALIIHDLNDLIELTDRRHNLIVVSGFGISVKSPGSILDQCVKKYMCDLFQWILYK